MKPKRIYISGPMSGHADLNFPAFHAAEAELTALGFEVVNPANLNPPGTDYDQCMKTDLKAMLDCDTLALLPGWEQSKGAHLELHVAHRVGIRVCRYEDIPRILNEEAMREYYKADRKSTGVIIQSK